jgi:hypothetical protein
MFITGFSYDLRLLLICNNPTMFEVFLVMRSADLSAITLGTSAEEGVAADESAVNPSRRVIAVREVRETT